MELSNMNKRALECAEVDEMKTDDLSSNSKRLKTNESANHKTLPEQEACQSQEYLSFSNTDQKLPILSEKNVGIEVYLSEHKGFSGVIKQRYRDFVVNEIREGTEEIVHLTSYSCPVEDTQQEDFTDVLSDEDKKALNDILQTKDKRTHRMLASEDKVKRTRVHQAIRQDYPKLETKTVEIDNIKYIEVARMSGEGKARTPQWPKDRPHYCRFVLYKENLTQSDALALVAKYLHMRSNNFQVAGTKDKRAVTVQEVTIFKVAAERLAHLNNVIRNVRVGNFRYVDRSMNLGELAGNHFQIILRNVSGDKADIDAALTSLCDVGFINYFGMQRFGNSEISTFLIGKALLKNQWEEAVNMILKPREGDKKEDLAWKTVWVNTRDANETMKKLQQNQKLGLMFNMLMYLKKTNHDYFKAFDMVPRHMKTLYLHSYQSYVWNKVASRRIQKYGPKVMVGDLVEKKGSLPDVQDPSSSLSPEVITEDNINEYSLYDVILPVPGYKVQFPQNEVSDWYTELLQADELTLDHFKHKVKTLALPGAYRKLIVKPKDVSWKLISYNDVIAPLIQTDVEKLENVPQPEVMEDGKYQALQICLSLPSSAYATMALREVLKQETSSSFQATLNT